MSVVASLAACALLVPRAAHADGTAEDKVLATALFHEARALLEAGDVALACRKLEESHRLEPAGGTLLNLAVCHEREGRSATAWSELQRARAIAERDGRADRVAFAEDRLRAIEPSLSKITIVVTGAPGLEITLDERVVRSAAWGTAMPLDPGTHVIEVRAPKKKPWRTEVDLQANGDAKTVTVPALEDEAPARAAAPVPLPASHMAESPVAVWPSAPDRTGAIMAGAIGVGALAIGGWFGIRAITKHDASTNACVTSPCSAASEALNESAKAAADVSTGAFIVGLVALGVGTWLWLSGDASPRRARPATASRQY